VPLVSITRLRVRLFLYLPAFFIYSLRVARQAKSAPGNLAVSALRDSNFTFWTRTLWTDERAMRGFYGVRRAPQRDASTPGMVRRGCRRPLDSGITGAAAVAGDPSAFAKGRPALAGQSSVRGPSSL
jgi:hypothetical protein